MESQNNELTQNDLLNASIVFSQAISLMLDDGQGIIVDILPEMGIVLPEETDKVVVFKFNNAVHIQKYDGDLEAGTSVNINEPEEETQETQEVLSTLNNNFEIEGRYSKTGKKLS